MGTQSLGSSTTDNDANNFGFSARYTFVAFTANETQTIDSIDFYVSENASMSRTCKVMVYTRSGTTIGTQVGGDSDTISSWGTGTKTWTFSGTKPSVTSSSTYYVVFDRSASGTGYIRLGETTGSNTELVYHKADLSGSPTRQDNIVTINVKINYTPADITVNVTALTLSTTDEEPTIVTTIPGGALNLSMDLIEPTYVNTSIPYIRVGTGTKGTKIVKTKWPIIEGYDLGTTKINNRETSLRYEKTYVPRRYKTGIY